MMEDGNAQGRFDTGRLVAGAILVLAGIAWLLARILEFRFGRYGWPLFVMVPGVLLLAAGLSASGRGTAATAAFGSLVTGVGALLFYQNAAGHFESWAYAWTVPTLIAVGAGLWVRARLVDDEEAARAAVGTMRTGAVLFVIGFVFFEGIIGISGRDFGLVGELALPVLLIALGVGVIVRHSGRSGPSTPP